MRISQNHDKVAYHSLARTPSATAYKGDPKLSMSMVVRSGKTFFSNFGFPILLIGALEVH